MLGRIRAAAGAVLVCALVGGGACAVSGRATAPGPALDRDLDAAAAHALDFARAQLGRTIGEVVDPSLFPEYTQADGTWKTAGPRDWRSGFFPGCLWLVSEFTREPAFRAAAERWTAGMAPVQFWGGTHDLGFMIFDSFGQGQRLAPSDAYKKVILQAADTLATRFNPKVGCLKSWDNPKWAFPVIIDNMMNLEILFWAALNGGPASLRDIAFRHAETTMARHVRADGSTYHVVGYDPATGAVTARNTAQGQADDSTWARGQAWAIYGFTMTYRFTRDPRFLATARRAADYFLGHLPADGVPYWDFQAPGIPNEPRDASAAAIAASALFELASFGDAPANRDRYLGEARRILRSLCAPPYLAEGTASHGILAHSVGSKPGNAEVDTSVIYADYYFLEALGRFRARGE
jgi:unsaturated chondroitin disaccharide hydrolase